MTASDGPALHIDWTACEGRGLCIELLPELLSADDWGYPVITPGPVPAELRARARQTVTACPTLALRLARR